MLMSVLAMDVKLKPAEGTSKVFVSQYSKIKNF